MGQQEKIAEAVKRAFAKSGASEVEIDRVTLAACAIEGLGPFQTPEAIAANFDSGRLVAEYETAEAEVPSRTATFVKLLQDGREVLLTCVDHRGVVRGFANIGPGFLDQGDVRTCR